MKIDIAPDSPGSENVLRQRRNQQAATNAWLRQMEVAMLVQPSPPQSERRGLPSGHPDVSSVAATGRDPGLTVNMRGAASRAVEPSGKWAASQSASGSAADDDSRLVNGEPDEAGALGRDAGAASEVVDTQERSAMQVSTAPVVASAPFNMGEPRAGARTEAAGSVAFPDEPSAMGSLSIARWGGSVGTDAAATEVIEPTELAEPPEPAPEAVDPPGKRAMHLTRDGSGVHVSIRDTSLGATAQWTLIGRLAAQLQGAGLNLRGMTINGDRRYERIDEDQAQLGDLFVTSPPNPDTAPNTSRFLRGDGHAG